MLIFAISNLAKGEENDSGTRKVTQSGRQNKEGQQCASVGVLENETTCNLNMPIQVECLTEYSV
jgi:hypothetical protein